MSPAQNSAWLRITKSCMLVRLLVITWLALVSSPYICAAMQSTVPKNLSLEKLNLEVPWEKESCGHSPCKHVSPTNEPKCIVGLSRHGMQFWVLFFNPKVTGTGDSLLTMAIAFSVQSRRKLMLEWSYGNAFVLIICRCQQILTGQLFLLTLLIKGCVTC